MKEDTAQHILRAARQCFFRHGYKNTTMSLISEYAGYSRVTLHKYFPNKDHIFRSVCDDYQQHCNHNSQQIMQQNLPCWQAIEQIMAVWANSIFEEVNDRLVLKDLHYHVQQVAGDIFDRAHHQLTKMVETLIEKGVAQKQLSLSACGLNSQQLAILVVTCFDGIRTEIEAQQILTVSHQLIALYRVATAPNH